MRACPKCGFAQVTRSIPQNRSYWLLCIEPMAEVAGTTPIEMHECLKEELLSRYITVKTKTGVQFKRVVGSTTEMKTKEFSDYLERVKEIAARVYGLTLRDPNQKD